MKPIRRYFTFSNLLASLALFIALGGSAYAVSAQSVGSKELRNRAVTQAKIRNGAVTAPKIRANSVTTRKIRNGAVRRNKIANGAVGAAKIANASIGAAKIASGAIDRSKLNLSELGVLPAAQHAATAQHADLAGAAETAEKATFAETATSAGIAAEATKAAFLTGRTAFNHRMPLGSIRTFAYNGDVSIRAQCILLAGQRSVLITGQTTSNGAVLLSPTLDDQLAGGASNSDFLNVDTPEADRRMELTGGTHPSVAQSGSGLIMDKDGKGLTFAAGDIVMGVNFSGVDCLVFGVVTMVG